MQLGLLQSLMSADIICSERGCVILRGQTWGVPGASVP